MRTFFIDFQKNRNFLLTIKPHIDIILKLSKFSNFDSLAQLAEHLTFNQGVRGSNPRWITTSNSA